MCYDFNFNFHVFFSKFRHTNAGPDRLMIRHPLPHIPNHPLQYVTIQEHMVRVHPEYLFPAFASCFTECQVHVCESLVDLCVDIGRYDIRFRIPAS
jgi:hypothetical protein